MKIDKVLRNKIRRQIIATLNNPENREVVIKTPYKLTKEQLGTIKKSIPSLSDSRLSNTIDESLLAGMIIVDGSTIIDYSMKGKLNEVIDSLLEN